MGTMFDNCNILEEYKPKFNSIFVMS